MMRRAFRWLLALGGALVTAAAWAFVPSAGKVSDAVAQGNARAGRDQPLQLEIVLQDAIGNQEGSGTAVFRPTGEAHLELRMPSGVVEVHHLAGGHEFVTREGRGRPLERPLLPPLALIQAESGESLRALLRALGGADDRVELGLEGRRDCYVLGGRGGPPAADSASAGPVALWVDLETLNAVRIDRADGVRFRLGPPVARGKVHFPTYIEVEAPGRPAWRLEIRDVAPASASR
jgi:hypothetical protein